MKQFRILRLLNVHFNVCCSKIFWPILLLFCILNQSAAFFILIRHHAHIPLFAIFLFGQGLIGWCLFGLTVFPRFHGSEAGSKEFLEMVLGRAADNANDESSPEIMEELRLLRKSVKATRHLTCEVAGTFQINLGFMLNFYAFVVDVTVNALLF